MNDISRIEEFLNLIKLIAKEYPIDKNIVYGNLVYYGENQDNIEELFNVWIKEFENDKNMKVYVPYNWNNFCQFRSTKENNSPNNKIKIYISIDKEHIEEAVKQIFHYLSRIKANHISKVSKNIRYDDIVIRVNDIITARKIGEFIAHNNYIKSGLIDTFPFTFNDGLISYTWDGEISYNMVIATYIANYINHQKRNNELDKVSYVDFVSYIEDIYKEVFIDGNNIDEYKEIMDIEDYNIPIEEVKAKLLNYQIITGILIKAMKPNKNIEEFYKEYTQITTYGTNLYDYIYRALVKKYRNYRLVDDQILNYLLDNNKEHFTRNASGINIRKIIEDNNLNNKSLQSLMLNSEYRRSLQNLLYKITSDTITAHSEEIALKALIDYQKKYQMRYFNADSQLRKKIHESIHPNGLVGIIRESLIKEGYKIEEIPWNDIELFNEYIELIKSYLHNKIK